MTRKTLYADDVKAAIKKLFDTLPMISRTDLFAAIDSLPAAEPDAGERVAREYAELVRLCRQLLNQEWEQLNLDPIGEFITELDANGFISDLAASRPSEKE